MTSASSQKPAKKARPPLPCDYALVELVASNINASGTGRDLVTVDLDTYTSRAAAEAVGVSMASAGRRVAILPILRSRPRY
jgi:hypothetical protein